MSELIYKNEVYAIIGAAMEVYNELGPGFFEAVYQEALEIEFADRGIPYVSQPNIPVTYKGRQLKKFYIPDFLLFERIVLEIKAQDSLSSVDEAQLLNELKVSCMNLGLLVNFGYPDKLQWVRRANTRREPSNREKFMKDIRGGE